MRHLFLCGVISALAIVSSGTSVQAQGEPDLFCASAPNCGAFYPDVRTCATPWLKIRPSERERWEAAQEERCKKEEAEKRDRDRIKAEERERAARAERASKEAELKRQQVQADEKRAREAALAKYQQEAEERQKKKAERIAAREAEDAALGYKHISVTDFLLDYRQMAVGTKVVLEGLHYSLGQVETLSETVGSAQSIFLDTRGLPREIRKSVIECHNRMPYCGATIWAHTGCQMNAFGHATEAPCLIVDLLSGGHYADQAASLRSHLPPATTQ